MEKPFKYGVDCDDDKVSNAFFLRNVTGYSALIDINHEVSEETTFYFCLKVNDSARFVHQGSHPWLSIVVSPKPQKSLPLPLQVFNLPIINCFIYFCHSRIR